MTYYMNNKDFNEFENDLEAQQEFDKLLNETKNKINSYTIDSYGCEYEDKDGAVILRITFDPLDRDLFDFEFIEEELSFKIKNFNLEEIS